MLNAPLFSRHIHALTTLDIKGRCEWWMGKKTLAKTFDSPIGPEEGEEGDV
jgi:hypothetical protein